MAIGVKIRAILLVVIPAVVVSACQTTLGQTSMWIRPGMNVAGRSVENGDGEQIYMEPFDPRGDSIFIMVRFYPAKENDKGKLTTSKLRDWPKKLKERLKLDK